MKPNIFFSASLLLIVTVIISACSGSTAAVPAGSDDAEVQVPPAVLPEPEPGQPTAVARYNTLIFSGPGENYVVYGAFIGSQKAQIIGKNEQGSWLAVSVPPAPTGAGWVNAEWVTASNAGSLPILPIPPVPPSTELVPPTVEDPQATALVNTFIRTGPSSSYPAYGIAEKGSSGRILGKNADGSWLVVRIDPKTVGAGHGWVEANFVQALNHEDIPALQAADSPSSISPPPAPDGSPRAVALDYINVRSGPGFEYPIYFISVPGAGAEITGKSKDHQWWQIKISPEYIASGAAWVADAVVITENTEDIPTVEAPSRPAYPEQPPISDGCLLIDQDPEDYTSIPPGAPFTISWTLQNTGGKIWDQVDYQLRYFGSSSLRLHEGSDLYQLNNSVEIGENFTVSGQMIAPSIPGTYSETWTIASDQGSACPFWVTIIVE